MLAAKRHEVSKGKADKGKVLQRKPEETPPSPINPIWHRFATSVPGVQAKLKIGPPRDKYEQEADRVAEQVMRMPEVQRQVAPGLEEEEDALQAKSADGSGTGSAQVDHPLIQNVLSSPGQRLDAVTRSFMEPRFGQDFSEVRVHTDGQAAESARALDAGAYTVGRNVVFGEGQYMAGSSDGRRLLAHELTHVVQQFSAKKNINVKNKLFRDQAKEGSSRYSPGTNGELGEAPGWDYIVYSDHIKLRYLKNEIKVGTIPWITNNPGNLTVTIGDAVLSPLEKLPFRLGAAKETAFQSRKTGKKYAIFAGADTGEGAIYGYLKGYTDRSLEAVLRGYLGPKETHLTQYGESHEGYLDYIKAACRKQGLSEQGITNLLAQNINSISDEQLIPIVEGILNAEGKNVVPGVIFSCSSGFDYPNNARFSDAQTAVINNLTTSTLVYNKLRSMLGCN